MHKHSSCCFTGYRPQKFPFSLVKGTEKYIKLENALTDNILMLINEGVSEFITGGAEGFDTIAAETVIYIRDELKMGIMLTVAIPFRGQDSRFSDEWKKRYKAVLEKADKKVLISNEYYTGVYKKRNEFMVDRSDFCIAFYDGKTGGTRNTVLYANKTGKTLINICDIINRT